MNFVWLGRGMMFELLLCQSCAALSVTEQSLMNLILYLTKLKSLTQILCFSLPFLELKY